MKENIKTAISKGDIGALKFIMNSGTVNQEDLYLNIIEESPLINCIASNNIEMVKYALEHNIVTHKYGDDLLRAAIEYCNLSLLQYITDTIDIMSIVSIIGYAIARNDYDAFYYLLHHKKNANISPDVLGELFVNCNCDLVFMKAIIEFDRSINKVYIEQAIMKARRCSTICF